MVKIPTRIEYKNIYLKKFYVLLEVGTNISSSDLKRYIHMYVAALHDL